jgi:hypothetical protein
MKSRSGVYPQCTPSVYPPELIAEVVRLARQTTLSQTSIGIKLGLSKSQVQIILKRAGDIKTKHWDERRHGPRYERTGLDEKPAPRISLARVPSLEREEVA